MDPGSPASNFGGMSGIGLDQTTDPDAYHKLLREHKEVLQEMGHVKAKLQSTEAERARLDAAQKVQDNTHEELRRKFDEAQQKMEAENRMSAEAAFASYKHKEAELLAAEGKSRAFAEKLAEAQKAFEEEISRRRDQDVRARSEADSLMESARGNNRSITEDVRANLARMDEEGKRRFQEFEKEQREAREEDQKNLLDREREKARLEGEKEVLLQQKERLLQQVKDLEEKLKDSEARHGSTQAVSDRIEQLRKELESQRAEHSEKMRRQVESYERKLADIGERPKKGCFRF